MFFPTGAGKDWFILVPFPNWPCVLAPHVYKTPESDITRTCE